MDDPPWSNIVGLANRTISGFWTDEPLGWKQLKPRRRSWSTPESDDGSEHLTEQRPVVKHLGWCLARGWVGMRGQHGVVPGSKLWTPNCCAEKAGPKPTWITFVAAQFPSRQCCRPDSAMVTRVKMAHLKSQCVSLMTLDLPHLGFPWIPWEGLVKEDPFLVYSGKPTVQWKKWLPALGRWEWPSPKISDAQIIQSGTSFYSTIWMGTTSVAGMNVEQWDIKKLHGILQFLAFL